MECSVCFKLKPNTAELLTVSGIGQICSECQSRERKEIIFDKQIKAWKIRPRQTVGV